MYYNTTNKTGSELTASKEKAVYQKDIVLAIFKKFKQQFAPHQVHNLYPDSYKVPLTSIRRAMSVLTRRGDLEKTDKKVVGPYAEPVHLWKLK